MADMRNLTENDTNNLKNFFENKIKPFNDEATLKTFKQEESYTVPQDVRLQQLVEKIESLERKIDLIFGGHILINGEFNKIFALTQK